jgi:hypothetical protein
MQFGFKCAIAHVIRSRQPFVQDRESAVEIARRSFSLSQRNLYEAVEQHYVLRAQAGGLTHVIEASADRAARRGCQP